MLALAGLMTAQTSDSFNLIAPVGTTVSDTRPVFRWQNLKGAESYVVEIYDVESILIFRSPPLHETEWTPATPLQSGQTYLWQVIARRGGKEVYAPPAPKEVRFKVASQRK